MAKNFELMIQCIRAMNNPNYRFIIMTQEEERANEIVSKLPNSDSCRSKKCIKKDLNFILFDSPLWFYIAR